MAKEQPDLGILPHRGGYQHKTDAYKVRPRTLAQHLRLEHFVDPKPAQKGYERSVWGWQHEVAHT